MFRAYADQSNEDREEGECEDDDRYSSFDQQKILEARNRPALAASCKSSIVGLKIDLSPVFGFMFVYLQRESIARAQHLVEREKNLNALRYINSDSDDDEVQIVVR
ncbi:unnamed protein product [Cylicostephanus goldi]|uniref:Uncharacterized protein n=1 Tax=Cylicostephanus goldi TaxID=71465 RepID=A0A3P6RVB7_CYLGO|nr:unnamed protein product [Cylicostephanus goldi]